MFCPRCAAQNADDAKFCRACGTDISLVPQAVTGQLAERLNREDDYSRAGRRRRRHGREPSMERAVKNFFMGLAFIFVAFAARAWAPAGNIWWFWLFISAAATRVARSRCAGRSPELMRSLALDESAYAVATCTRCTSRGPELARLLNVFCTLLL